MKAWVDRRSIQAVGQADASGQSDVPAEESEKPAEEQPLERTREWRCLLLAAYFSLLARTREARRTHGSDGVTERGAAWPAS